MLYFRIFVTSLPKVTKKPVFTKKVFWVLVIGFLNLVSVDAKERSLIAKSDHKRKTKNGMNETSSNLLHDYFEVEKIHLGPITAGKV